MTEEMSKVQWPGWETVRLIGQGSFGSVYEIQRDVLGSVERAALKVISIPQSNSDIDELYNDGYDEESITSTFQSHLQSIVAEYSLTRKMNGCSNIVNCDDVRYVQHADGFGWDIFIKMELLSPLTKALPECPSDELVIRIGRDLCNALVICRKHGIIHRDIKPQNIFVSENGDYKLGDFGIAKAVEKTTGGTKIGTYKYMAPEVYNNQPYGHSADIYSLGLVLYWLLNERRLPFLPLPPEKLRAGMDEAARLRRFSGEVLAAPAHGSETLKKIVLKACAFDPVQRYADAEEMRSELETLAGTVVPQIASAVLEKKSEFTGEQFSATAMPMTVQQMVVAKDNTPLPQIATIAVAQPWREPQKPESEKTSTESIWGVVEETPIAQNKEASEKTNKGVSAETTVGNVSEKEPESPFNESMVAKDRTEAAKTNQNIRKTVENTVRPKKKKQKSRWLLPVALCLAVTVGLVVCFFDRGGSISSRPTIETQLVNSQGDVSQNPNQWSEWSSSFPIDVATDKYELEKKVMRRVRQRETTTSTVTDKMDGWELYEIKRTAQNDVWSDWSDMKVSASDTRDVETRTLYRSREQLTTTSSASVMNGWELYDTYWIWNGQWTEWSAWSETAVSETFDREVKTHTQYSYRLKETMMTSSRDAFPGWTLESTESYDGGLAEYYTYSRWSDWSEWTDDASHFYCEYEERTRVLYSYRDKILTPTTYCFMKWSDWSAWGSSVIPQSTNRQVETMVQYRYRDVVVTDTYCFQRFGEWSEWTEEIIFPSETLAVEKNTFYRYRLK